MENVVETANTSARVSISTTGEATRAQTTVFEDQNSGEYLAFAETPAPVNSGASSIDLGHFLSRPTLIRTVTWTEGGGFGESSFDPWTLFFNTAAIKKKLDNFAFFRGNLHVKAVINAAPFYYGAGMMAYTPVPSMALTVPSTLRRYMTYSQRPHIWIYPQNSTGGEMVLPFIYHKEYLDITSAAAVALMGRLDTLQYVNLESANGATSNGCTLQIYAWVDNPVLIGPTVKLAMQGGDEYGNGPISAPASAVAHWAQYASKIPLIGKFARATSIGANAASGIAKLFGWTNVPVIDNVAPMKNLPFHGLASAHIGDPTSKFTLDPKGELSVDPSIVGLTGEDELAISHIVRRESYVCTSTWNTSDAAGALLLATRITPCMHDIGTPSAAGTYTIANTPLSWLNEMFDCWRGDLVFRFKVICSKYHQGRLRITWDPLGDLSATSDYSHLAFTKVVDLGESDEIEFRVPFMQALPWLKTRRTSAANNWSTTTYVVGSDASDNGTLTVRVLTNLSAPVDTAPVSILTFVRGGENLEFSNPRDLDRLYSVYTMQSGLGPDLTSGARGERYLVNWGEAIHSLRTILRRSTHIDSLQIGLDASATDLQGALFWLQSRKPSAPGYDPDTFTSALGVETPANTYKFSYTSMSPLVWIASAFMLQRGGVRWHFNTNCTASALQSVHINRRIQSTSIGDVSFEGRYISLATSGVTSRSIAKKADWATFNQRGASGVVVSNTVTQSGIGVEFPMMTNCLFEYANPVYNTRGAAIDGSNLNTYSGAIRFRPTLTNVNYMSVERFACAGTDFTLHFFLSAPTIYYNPAAGNVPV